MRARSSRLAGPGRACAGSMSAAATARSREMFVERCAPAEVQGIDPSEGQLAYARTRPGAASAQIYQGDAMACRFPTRVSMRRRWRW